MLENVWNASVVRRIGLEADAKDIIGVVASDMQVIGASLIMLEMQGRQFKLRDMLSSFDREAMELLAGFREAGEIGNGSIAATERVWPAAGCCLGGPSRGGVTGAQHRRWVVQAGFNCRRRVLLEKVDRRWVDDVCGAICKSGIVPNGNGPGAE